MSGVKAPQGRLLASCFAASGPPCSSSSQASTSSSTRAFVPAATRFLLGRAVRARATGRWRQAHAALAIPRTAAATAASRGAFPSSFATARGTLLAPSQTLPSPLRLRQGLRAHAAAPLSSQDHPNDPAAAAVAGVRPKTTRTGTGRGSGAKGSREGRKFAVDAHLKGIAKYDEEHLHSARNLTGVQITFLGTSGGSPTLNRNVSSLALELTLHRSVNETWLFDCGEATQTRLMQSNLKVTNITKIFITHMHGDHIFGLPGVLCMLSNSRSKAIKENPGGVSNSWALEPLHIYGPPGIASYVTMSLGLSESSLSIPVVVHEFSDQPPSALMNGNANRSAGASAVPYLATNRKLKNKVRVELVPACEKSLGIRNKIVQVVTTEPENAKKYSWRRNRQHGALDKWECMRWPLDLGGESKGAVEVVACPLKHRVDCWGYVVRELDQPGKMDPQRVKALGLPRGPILKTLKNGQPVQCPDTDRWIKPEEVLGPNLPGRKVVILGDTCDNRWIAQNARGADVVVHEATFTNDMRERALIAGHSTAGMAGNFAKYVDAGSLILTHFSARFEDTDSQWEELRRTNAKGKLKDLMQASRASEIGSINTLKKQAAAKFGKESVFAAEDLMVYCVEKKDPHNSQVPSHVFPRHLDSLL